MHVNEALVDGHTSSKSFFVLINLFSGHLPFQQNILAKYQPNSFELFSHSVLCKVSLHSNYSEQI